MIYLISFVIALALVLLAGVIVLGKFRSRGHIERALNMSLFLVTLPRETNSANRNSTAVKTEKELISVMEQLVSSFSSLHSKGWNKFSYGEPYIALELAVHDQGQHIHFYISTPNSYNEVVQKQIYSLFPNARVKKVDDYNIFNPKGVALGADLRLKEDQILPFKTYTSLESDPMNSIITSMSKLEKEGEGASLQILLKPSHKTNFKSKATKVIKYMQNGDDFKSAVAKSKNPPSKKKDEQGKEIPEEVKPVLPSNQEIMNAIQSKASKQTFDTNIRIMVSALSDGRARQILENLKGAFTQYDAPDLNSFKTNVFNGKAFRKFSFNYSFRIFNNKTTSYLSTEEISSIFHFPVATTQAPQIVHQENRESEPPAGLPKEGIVLGINNFRDTETIVRMTLEDRRRHTYIIGQTGTGKTTVMKDMIRQDLEAGKGFCVIDPHGDLAEYVLSVVPKSRAGDIIYFDPSDTERPLGLNIFEINPSIPEQKTFVINELLSIIDRLYNLKETGGPMFEKYFRNACLLLLDDYNREVPTIADISRVLVDEKFREDKLSRETNVLVRQFWELEAQKAGGEAALANMAPYISSKIDAFISNDFLRPIIMQKHSSFNFRNIMDDKKVLVINLSKGKLGEINANLLGSMLVSKLLMAALSRVDIDENQRNDFYLYIDEFQNFTTDSIATILSEARKYRLDLIIAHQFIKQLPEDIRDAVFGNVGSIISFRISPDDAEFMKNKFDPTFTPQDLMKIKNLKAYVNLLVNGRVAEPFDLDIRTDRVFGAGSIEMVKFIKDLSRQKLGRSREEIEKEINQAYKNQ